MSARRSKERKVCEEKLQFTSTRFLIKNNERTKEEVYGSARATSPQFAIYIPPLPFVFQTTKKHETTLAIRKM
jgi:hypothetical protein